MNLLQLLKYKHENEKEINFLRKELFYLHEEWEYILDIFGKDDNIELINKAEPVAHLFQYIQHALLSSVTHRISRLLDPAKNGKNKNLSLKWYRSSLDCFQRESNEALWRLIIYDGRIIKKLRNKVLSHNDFNTVGSIDKLTWNNGSIDRIIKNINKYFINTIDEDFMGKFKRDDRGVDILMELLKENKTL